MCIYVCIYIYIYIYFNITIYCIYWTIVNPFLSYELFAGFNFCKFSAIPTMISSYWSVAYLQRYGRKGPAAPTSSQ